MAIDFAHDTKVPVSKTRMEIDALLRQWGCTALQWTDEFERGHAQLRFRWRHDELVYAARFDVQMPSVAELNKEFSSRSPLSQAAQLRRSADQRWRSLHRVLLLRIKADLNCVAAGLTTAFDVFLAHIENGQGRTVAESLEGRDLTRFLLTGPTADH